MLGFFDQYVDMKKDLDDSPSSLSLLTVEAGAPGLLLLFLCVTNTVHSILVIKMDYTVKFMPVKLSMAIDQQIVNHHFNETQKQSMGILQGPYINHH